MHDANREQGNHHADELLHAAERALFDATSRLQEALVLIDRQGLQTPTETLDRVRQWTALIHRGIDRLGTARALPPARLEA